MLENKELLAAAAAADESTLTALSNKGVYKRALKDIEGISPDFIEVGGQAVVTVGGAQCSVTLPFEKSRCTCPSRTVCRHIIAAILLLKAQAPDDLVTSAPQEPAPAEKAHDPEPEKPKKPVKNDTLSAAETETVREIASVCSELLGGVLIHGLVRVTASTAEDFELAAVRCHAAKMADAERLMRDLGSRLASCAARRASFDSRAFTERLIACDEYLNSLMTGTLTEEMLGAFRRSYDVHYDRLELLPIGQRGRDEGTYRGEIYYFLNADESSPRRFLTYSDMTPTFYGKSGKRRPVTTVWNTQMSMKRNMKSRMVLSNAKANSGRLSGSNETEIISSTRINLNCPEMRRMICCDFREPAVELSKRDPECEADTLFLIHPDRLIDYKFDKLNQTLNMYLEDEHGNTVRAQAKYRAETKTLIDLLEKICERMKKFDGLFYTMLVSAYIRDGELIFYPIEVYDFLDGIEMHRYELPKKYEDMYSYASSVRKLIHLLSEVNRTLETVMLSGLQSAVEDHRPLVRYCRECGMDGLAELSEAALSAADNYRHTPDASAHEVLASMRRLTEYLNAAEKKAGTVSALCRMKGE